MQMRIVYDLEVARSGREVVEVSFDADKLVLDAPPAESLPEWAALDFCRCRNCPLEPEQHTHCPVAAQLVGIAARFGDTESHAEVTLHVRMPERVVSARTTAQAALGSLIGLVMPLSGCPRLAPLAPMARFHLPLSTHEETIYRVTSMYMLTRYFDRETASEVTPLAGLSEIYAGIQTVNQGISDRMRQSKAFAEVNSVAILDIYAQTMPMVIEDALEDIRHLFDRQEEVA